MLPNRTEDQKDALERAAECRRKADSARFEDLRADYLEMEQRWLRLAESPPMAGTALPDDYLPGSTDAQRPRGPHATASTMWAKICNLHQTMSWNAGYGRGREGRPFSCPWWVNQIVFSDGYLNGKSDRGLPSKRRLSQ